MSNENNGSGNAANNLLIEFAYKRTQGFLRKISTPYPIQGLHYEYGFKITNTGNNEFLGGKLNNVKVKFITTDTALQSPDVHMIPPLAPKKSVIVYANNTIFDYPGAIWVSCHISPNEGRVKTFQCSRGHQNYVSVNPVNEWSNAVYVVPHMEHIQSLTNIYIILLTVVTLALGVASLFLG